MNSHPSGHNTQQPLQNLVTKAIKFHQKGKLAEAKGLYKKILERDPNNPDANHMYGVIALQENNFDSAIALINKSIKQVPTNKTAHFNLGLALQNVNRCDKAAEAYQKAIDIDPNYITAIANLGSMFMYLEDYALAEEKFRCAIGKQPNNPALLNNLALCLFNKREIRKAVEYYQKALKLDQGNPEILNNIGCAFQHLGEIGSAINCYQTAFHIKNDYIKTLTNLAYAYDIQNQQEEALTYYKAAVSSKKDCATAHTALAVIYWQKNELLFCRDHLDALNSVKSIDYTQKEITYIEGYRNFLEALLEYQKKNIDNAQESALDSQKSKNTIHIIGDSHCLSFSNQNLNSNKIETHLVVGCKAWHLSNTENNEYKINFTNKLMSLPKEAKALLFFGEIDCRLNEGILPYCEKTRTPIEDAVSRLLDGYISYTQQQARINHNQIVYFNIPAPLINNKTKEDTRHAEVIRIFNEKLSQKIDDNQLINIYDITKNMAGFANGSYHIDGVHLSPEVLNKIKTSSRF